MSGSVGSIAQAVREVLNRDRFYLEVLDSGIANLTALAEKIKPDVEKKVESSVSTRSTEKNLRPPPESRTSG